MELKILTSRVQTPSLPLPRDGLDYYKCSQEGACLQYHLLKKFSRKQRRMKIKIGESEYPGRGSENKTMQAYAASHLQIWRFHKGKKSLYCSWINDFPFTRELTLKDIQNGSQGIHANCEVCFYPPPLFLSQSQGCKYLSVLYPCQHTLEQVKGTWHWITGICVANK